MSNRRSIFKLMLLFLVIVGVIDTGYLTYKHFFQPIGICLAGPFGDCGKVLSSEYSILFGVPLALLGMLHYLWMGTLVWLSYSLGSDIYKRFAFIQSAIGVVFSLYLTYLQFFIIKSLCPYCLFSALVCLTIYIFIRKEWHDEYKSFVLEKIEIVYKLFAKPLFFILPAEWVHEQAMYWGELAGKIPLKKVVLRHMFSFKHPVLQQKIGKTIFENPIGLSAGYDYMSSFTQILPTIGFGFETVGTISNMPFEGNKKPRLGRLPLSRSLLVNKGFRNPGADVTIKKLKRMSFEFPLGISIGKTNSIEIAGTQKDAVSDVVEAFKKFQKGRLKNAYYELNISCPNLKGGVSFYPPKELKKLLLALDIVKIKKPVFVKMPIEKTDDEVKKMLDVIVKHKWITGVIFGNLQKDRKDPSLVVEEIQKAGVGNFSGKPTYRRSNELIKLAYSGYGKKLIIIGCGGVFTPEDAYRKIRLGATLIQMITGMIFEGPQRITQINRGLVELLQADGYSNISEAVGVDA
ncbi:MAG: dihydroorotate dehydrogenase (quinone) [Candidatus Roizmanbacteria bacterium]|nr:dihydroorotate dehydrogenase (quinone) [Candidatus Roizmanbacteria bacterium]